MSKPTAIIWGSLVLAAIALGGCDGTTSNTTSPSPVASEAAGKPSETASKPAEAAITGDITVDGSSTVFPLSEAVAEEFQASKQNKIKVGVGKSGTGGGFKKFCRGEIAIVGASRPILEKEITACQEKGIEYIELPVAYDALTVVVNPSNTWATTLKIDELKKIWQPEAQGKVMNWKEVRAGFPDAPLRLFGPGASSGTFDYFTEAVNGKPKASRGDYTGSEDDNILVSGVGGDKNALGYFGYSYYEANKAKLKAVGIDSGKGPVLPSEATVKDGTYSPLSRPLFIYVNAKDADKAEVKEFVSFYLDNSAKLGSEIKLVPLTDALYTKIKERASKKTTGTLFGGKEAIGLKLEDLLKKEK